MNQEVIIPYPEDKPVPRIQHHEFTTEFAVLADNLGQIIPAARIFEDIIGWLFQNVITTFHKDCEWEFISKASILGEPLRISMFISFAREEDLVAFRLRWGHGA